MFTAYSKITKELRLCVNYLKGYNILTYFLVKIILRNQSTIAFVIVHKHIHSKHLITIKSFTPNNRVAYPHIFGRNICNVSVGPASALRNTGA